jgi:hypothetical protein
MRVEMRRGGGKSGKVKGVSQRDDFLVGERVESLVPLEEVPLGSEDTGIESTVGRESGEEGGGQVQVTLSTAGALVDDDGSSGLSSDGDSNTLSTVATSVLLEDGGVEGDDPVIGT